MKGRLIGFLCFCLLLLGAATAVHAEDEFHLLYEKRILVEDGQTVSGVLLVQLINNSGADVRDVVAWIPEANNVTYDHRSLMFGDLAVAQPQGVLDEWTLPVEVTDTELPEGPVTWRIEYTNIIGDRVETDVVGDPVL